MKMILNEDKLSKKKSNELFNLEWSKIMQNQILR